MTSRGPLDRWQQQLPGPPAQATCDRDGAVWHVVAGDLAATVPHSIGMSYLAELVHHPGREIAAIELASGCRGGGSGVRHAVLDPTARARYRAEIAVLQVEIDDADRCADLERAAQARVQLDRLVDELAVVTGLGGRLPLLPR